MKIQDFVKEACGQVNPRILLGEHREFLSSFPPVIQILTSLDAGKIFPTPALQKILLLLSKAKDPVRVKVEKPKTLKPAKERANSEEEAEEPSARPVKRYQLFLFRKERGGLVVVDEPLKAGTFQEAWRMANRTLFNNEDSLYLDIVGDGVATRIQRDVAVGEILKAAKGPATRKTAKMSDGLGWKCSAKSYVAKFSHG